MLNIISKHAAVTSYVKNYLFKFFIQQNNYIYLKKCVVTSLHNLFHNYMLENIFLSTHWRGALALCMQAEISHASLE
jgi:hypothetical protein